MGFASPAKPQVATGGVRNAIRSKPANVDGGAAFRSTVASHESNTVRGSRSGAAMPLSTESRPPDAAWKNASVSAATCSTSSCANGVGPHVAIT